MNDQVPDFRGLHVAAFESRPADDVARLIEKHGGVPHVSPSMRETPLDDHRSAVDFAHRLITGDVDIAVFLTGGGFRERLAIVQRHVGRQRYLNALSDIVTIARGPKPAAAMKEAGVTGMTIPPHSGEIRDDKLYGRGASDTRGGIAVAIMAALVLHEFRDQLRGSLTIFSAVDEECNGGGAGAMACLQRLKRRPAPVTGSSPLFTFAVCTDGSGPTVTRGFGGVITGELCVHGQGGHAAAPGGVNAIDKAVIVKGALDAFKQERETAGAGPVNLGIFRAGVHPAVIPAEASAGGTSEGLALVELPRVPRCPSASRLGELREGLVGMEGRGGWGRCGVRLPPVCGIGLEGTVRQSVRSGGARLDFGDCAVCPAHPPFGRGSAVG